jgi:hypothetical protein
LRNKERRHATVRDFAQALAKYAGEPAPTTSSKMVRSGGLVTAPARPFGLGTAETEVDSAPTWVALAEAPSTNPRADRECQRLSSSEGTRGLIEEFCRDPEGTAPRPALQARHQHLSQRALLLSVGALALSVVAMTTMFIFVYSHGSGALEAATPAAQVSSSGAALASVTGHRTQADPNAPVPAAKVPQCPAPGDPLHRASMVELAFEDENGLSVLRRALKPMSAGGAIADESTTAAGCE